MFSAGQYYGQTTGTGPNQSTSWQPQPPVAGSSQTGIPMVQMLPQPGGMNFNLNADLDPEKATAMVERQQKLGEATTAINGGIALLNAATSWGVIIAQNEQMGRYYDYLNKVADDARSVTLAEINLREKAMYHEEAMMEEKNRHEQELARIEQRTQIRLAKIAENGKTERAGIYAANNAFARDYNYGSPVC